MPGESMDLEGWLHLPTSVLLNEAWQVRRRYFDNKVLFATPGAKGYANEFYCNNRNRFVTISVTGQGCALNCDHCRTKLLRSMLPCPEPEDLLVTVKGLRDRGCQGLLISGGADQSGAVPLAPFLGAIKEIKGWGLQVIVHTGLAGEEVIAGLKEAEVDQVLVDIIGARETIREVYLMDYGPEAYGNFLKLCLQYDLEVAPHIVVG
ncbi:MAG: lipoyl synthase, partial [Clostridia bacterium]|nr:lipoyl synthase [Clostridia bacterium]